MHVVVNNLIGFTTPTARLHSSRFATDIAKRLADPDLPRERRGPEAVVRVARLAAEYRYAFDSDVVIDLVGYRRHGHSEVDDPTITQPLHVQGDQGAPAALEGVRERATGLAMPASAARVAEENRGRAQEDAHEPASAALRAAAGLLVARTAGGCYNASSKWTRACAHRGDSRGGRRTDRVARRLRDPSARSRKLLDQRGEMAAGSGRWTRAWRRRWRSAACSCRACRCGSPARTASAARSTSGTPCWSTSRPSAEYMPLSTCPRAGALRDLQLDALGGGRARLRVRLQPRLSRGAGAVGGAVRRLREQRPGDHRPVRRARARTSGDCCPGWCCCCRTDTKGQGPEHSSARIERFLQLAGEDNLQVCQPSTAAQYFHLLRRQALRRWRKPLVVFTPKSMLRHAGSSSPVEALTRGASRPCSPTTEVPAGARRMLLGTGKIVHELRAERKRRGDTTTAILGLEQLYPFPKTPLAQEIARYPEARELVWVQEEPANMGAHFYVMPRLRTISRSGVMSVKRRASASPATGSGKAHLLEQQALLALAFASSIKDKAGERDP